MFASEDGHAECVRVLLENGVDKDARNDVRYMSCHFRRFCVSGWKFLSVCQWITPG
jgi:hypothetical protein